MTKEELWNEFCQKRNIDRETEHEAWAFCGGGPFADELGRLVLEGKKFGTASLYQEFIEAGESLPKVKDYSVLLDQYNNAYAIVSETSVEVKTFGEISDYHGYSEGERDRDLVSWRDIHANYWKTDFERLNISFSKDVLVVAEKFTVEYLASDQRLLIGTDSDDLFEECFLIEPCMRYADQISAYRDAFLAAGDSFDGTLSLKRMSDPKEWVDYCIEWGNPARFEGKDIVHGTELMCIRKCDDKLVGMIQVQLIPEGNPMAAVGHIGYSVLPVERCKGYAKWMLKKACEFLNYAYKVPNAVISVLPENEASRRTILANGGVYKDRVFLEADQVMLDRYEIEFKKDSE